MLADNARYDVIVSDLFVPWESETGYLYTVEHYQLARQRLKTGGIFCQWLPLYQLGEREFEMIADSLASVFPSTSLWWGNFEPKKPIVALIGSELKMEVNVADLNKRLTQLNISKVVHDDYLATASMLHTLYAGDWPHRSTSELNTDEPPLVEFLTPVSHREGRLMSGLTLQRYFDKKLAHLPYSNSEFFDPVARTVWPTDQLHGERRFILFGE